MINEKSAFVTMNETEIMEIDGGIGIGTVLLIIGGVVIFAVGAYNGYKDTEQGAQ